jgi:hypothetical protein
MGQSNNDAHQTHRLILSMDYFRCSKSQIPQFTTITERILR